MVLESEENAFLFFALILSAVVYPYFMDFCTYRFNLDVISFITLPQLLVFSFVTMFCMMEV